MKTWIAIWLVSCVALVQGAEPEQDHVAGNMIMLNDNAGWCWYQDEKVIYDPAANAIIASTVANAVGFGGKPREADVDILSFQPATGRRTRVTMDNRPYGKVGDDHNMGSLWIRPDGTYLHMWTGHNEPTRNCFFRFSVKPHDASAWSEMQSFNWPTIGNPDTGKGQSATYNNLHYLSAERDGKGRLYNFTRESQRSPNIAYSDDLGSTWHYGGKLTLTRTRSSYSNGYVKYSSNGKNRIDFITTEHHPRDYNTSIFHGYIQDGKSFNSSGQVIDDNIFDEKAPAPEDFTPVFQAAAEGGVNADKEYHRAWTIELERDPQDHIYALFTTRYGTQVATRTPGEADHRLFYARFDGTRWHSTEIAKMGGPLWPHEEDYVGLGTIHPDNPNLVYISTKLDPRDGTTSPKREIYRGTTMDQGATWKWTAVTANSTVHNLRPAIPRWDARHTAVCWLRGEYGSQQSFDQTLVCLIDDPELMVGKVEYTDADNRNTTLVNSRWQKQAGFGNGEGVFMASDSPGEDASILTTTVQGVTDGTYDVFAFFWSRAGEDWGIRGGLSPSEMLAFRRFSSQHAEAVQFSTEVKVTGPEVGMYRCYLGRKIVKGDGEIKVHIDSLQGQTKTAYDGVGVARVTATK